MTAERSITVLDTPCREYRGSHHERGYGLRRRRIPRLHRWVMAQIHGEEAIRGREVMHLCDNPPCFRYDHLRIGSHAENMDDMVVKGRSGTQRCLFGDENPASRATDSEVRNIRERYAAGESVESLADEFGLHIASIHRFISGRTRLAAGGPTRSPRKSPTRRTT